MTSNRITQGNEDIEGEKDDPNVYKVGVPPNKTAFSELQRTVKDTFFHDEPLRMFKDQPTSKRLWLGIQSVFPILEWGKNYKLHMLRGDIIAGLTIASLAVPQDLGYAKLANLAPKFGLYGSFVPPLVYSVFGSSRDIAIGPVAVVSLLIGTLLQKEIDSKKHPTDYENLAFTATFFAGIIQLALGFFRLGFLIDFLSHAAVVGFMAGAAITIGLQQLKGLFGISNFTKKTDIVSVLHSVFADVKHQWHWESIVIGVVFLIYMLSSKYMAKKSRIFFWVSATAPLLSVIISTLCIYLTHADGRVQVVGKIARGVNPSSIHRIHFNGQYALVGFRIGVVTGLIALTEAVAIGRTFAALKDYNLSGNKEMVALGAMNVVGSFTSCYVTTGSFSRSSVNYMAGVNTTVSNIVMSLVVLLTLEVITPVFRYTPNAVISAIIITAVAGLVDIPAMILLWKVDKFDFIACMGAFFGVVFKSVEIGLLIAVCISFLKILLQVTRPRIALLGKIPSTNVYRNINQYPEASKVPGIVIVRVDSAIYFSNSNYVRERILLELANEDDKEPKRQRTQYLIIELSPVTDIDTSGIQALEDLHKSLQKRDVQVVLANPGHEVLAKLHESGFIETIHQEHIFLTVADAVLTLAPRLEP